MGNLFLGYPNRVTGCSFSGGSWVDRTKLATRDLSDVAETADATTAATQVIADMGATYTVRAVALLNHNLSSAATIAWSFGTSSGGTEAGSSGTINVWRMSFDGVMRNMPAQYSSVIGYPFWAPYVHSADMSCRYIKFAVTDTGNSLGKCRFGRLAIFGGVVPTYNMAIGASIDWNDLTQPERAGGGGLLYQQRRRFKTADIPLNNFDSTHRGKLMEMRRGAGVHDEVMFVPDAADMANAQEYGFVGRIAGGQKMPWSMPLAWSTVLSLEELL